MSHPNTPTREELVKSAAEVVPLLRTRARWINEHRRLPEDVIEALDNSGLFKMRVPAQYGGYESDARTLVDVHAELAKGDGSAAFCVSVWSLINWVAARFPDEVQDEVFATPNVRVCGTIAATGTATPTEGGYIFNGRWRFNSGVLHSHWKLTAAMLDSGPEDQREPYTALIPVSEFEIVDDWDTSGLRGSGSVTTIARDLFVPTARVVPTSKLFSDECPSKINAEKAMYQVPLLVTSTAATAGQAIGSAKYAMESFLERMPERGISYTDYHNQRDAPITHLRVGEAALLTEEAESRIHQFADLVAAKTAANEPWSEADRVRSRVQMGRVAQLAKQAVDILGMASGGSSIYADVPIQRIQRDMHALTIHALTSPDSNIELYGRQLCGLAPNTQYL